MGSIRQGAFRLFRFAGVDVFLHWSWFVVALFEINGRSRTYSSLTWNVLEYVALFAIVLMHEYGHALACRQVGGTANQIVLWPLGGVAYVDPPQRPGAMLWSLAAGPLVNVALVPVLAILGAVSRSAGLAARSHDFVALLEAIWIINIGLLVFNLLPVYPLDGGQILRSLLWFGIGRARSLMVATVIGFLGVAGLIAVAAYAQSVWIAVMAVFILMNCWAGLKNARMLLKIAKLPRRDGYACPSCNSAPPVGARWICGNCHLPFDTFETHAICPNCRAEYDVTRCLDCGRKNPMSEWMSGTLVTAKL
jgi:Zn-dependent protease